jgi:hypothetical protein
LGADAFRLDEWHEYHLSARGPHLTLRVNDKLVAEVLDHDADSFEAAGLLALQLHTGPPMKAQFKGIRLKRVPRDPPLSARATVLASAAFHWQLGERPDAHQPPLGAMGKVELRGPEAGQGGARFARLNPGWFDLQRDLNAPRLWNVPTAALTTYARVRVPKGDWRAPIFGKGHSNGALHFQLSGLGDDESTTRLGFWVRTDQGTFEASVPASALARDAWQALVGRYDGRRIQLFDHARLLAEAPAFGVLVPNEEPLVIGAELRAGQPQRTFTGDLEELALWPRALGDAEISLLNEP